MAALASSARMVGRRAELDALLDAYAEGRTGVPRTVVIRGEAGIGKTRLVQEFLAHAANHRSRELPLVVGIGQCVDLGPIGAPFGPIRRVLRDLHTAVGTDALRAAAGSPAAIATLGAFVPGIADEAADADEHPGEFAEAIEVVLEQLSAERHLVIVIEDLQWADAATLALLRTLASTLRGRHLTIAATYRSDDVDRFHPLRPVLAELDRTRSVIRVEIQRLSADEVGEQVGLLAGHELAADDVEALTTRSGGIPFLVEELVDLDDSRLPETLRELVLARYARLSEAAQEVMRVMAAGGVHTDDDALRAVSSREEHALDLALREAIDTRVIVADGAGYTFRHALTQEAVYGEMLPSERVRVHRRYAEHLSERWTDSPNSPDSPDSPDAVSAVAEHWLAAREIGAAFDATVVALRQSRATFAPATSVKLAERLTELWDQVPDAAARSGTTLPELLLASAQAWHELGDAERALRSANEGLAVCVDDPLVRAGLLRQRYVHESNTDKEPGSADLHEAVALLEGIEGHAARVLLSRTLTNLADEDRGSEPFATIDRAIALAEEAGDDAALAVALTVKSWRISDDEGDEPRSLEPLERALALRIDPAMRAHVGQAYISRLSGLGRFDEAATLGRLMYDEGTQAGIERGSGASIAIGVAHALFCAGDPEAASRYAQRARHLLDRPSRAGVVRLLATHYLWNDQPDEREALLTAERVALDELGRRHPESREWWDAESVDAVLRSAAGLGLGLPAARDAGREVDAGAWADRVDSIMSAIRRRGSPPARHYATIAAAMFVKALGRPAAEAEPEPGGPEAPLDVQALRDLVVAEVETWPAVGAVPAQAAFVRAVLADAGGAAAPERVALWRALVDAETDAVMPVRHRHIARLSLAAALVETGARDAASTLLDAIIADAPVQGVASVARWASELAARAGLGASPGRSGAVSGIESLTPRERQVLGLVAEGLTNTQIGERLFISPKTASVHVSAILAKVGAANRAEAAAVYAALR